MAERDTTTFIPLNKFRAFIDTLNDVEQTIYQTPSGVSTIALSIQFTNNGNDTEFITVYINSNSKKLSPQFNTLTNDGSYNGAADLIQLNLDFIVDEVKAYIIDFNLNNPPIIAIQPDVIAADIRKLVNAIIKDLRRGEFTNSRLVITAFYDKYGVLASPQLQLNRKIQSITHTNTLLQSIINNVAITPLYQSNLTQSFDGAIVDGDAGSTTIEIITNVASASLATPVFIDEPTVTLVNEYPIPQNDSFNPVVSGKIILEEGFSLIASGSSNISVVLSLLESANE